MTHVPPFGSSHSFSARLGVPCYSYRYDRAALVVPLTQSHVVSIVMLLIEDASRVTIYHNCGLDAHGGDSRL